MQYIIKCINKENNYNYLDEKRDNVILIKDNNNLFPIFEVVKNIKDKNIKLNKHFKYMNNNTNIVYQIHDYYNMNCNKDIIEKNGISISSHTIDLSINGNNESVDVNIYEKD